MYCQRSLRVTDIAKQCTRNNPSRQGSVEVKEHNKDLLCISLENMAERVLLPSNVTPTHYTLEITPDLVGFTFDVTEDITIAVHEDNVTEISLHSREINIHSATFTSGSVSLEAVGIAYDLKYNVVKLTFESSFPVGTANLNLKFTGILNNDMAGFYRCKYICV